MSDINALEIRKVYFHYKRKHQILNGIDLTVPRGMSFRVITASLIASSQEVFMDCWALPAAERQLYCDALWVD